VRATDRAQIIEGAKAVLTKDVLFGMNVLSVAGFVVMGSLLP
jgi:hypothetical protein